MDSVMLILIQMYTLQNPHILQILSCGLVLSFWNFTEEGIIMPALYDIEHKLF